MHADFVMPAKELRLRKSNIDFIEFVDAIAANMRLIRARALVAMPRTF
jgi:hypothetical protein